MSCTCLFSESGGKVGVIVGGDFNEEVVVVRGGVLNVKNAPVLVAVVVNDGWQHLEVAMEAANGSRAVAVGSPWITSVCRFTVGQSLGDTKERRNA